jgi:hypothetical protein
MPMNQEIKAQWTKALRSRKYKQGREALQKDGKFCCLGVLCELAVEAGVPIKKELNPYIPGGINYDGEAAYVPEVVAEWAGLNTFKPKVDFEGWATALDSLNDGDKEDSDGPYIRKPLGFRKIADLIDADADL